MKNIPIVSTPVSTPINDTFYFNAPSENLDVTKLAGRVKHPSLDAYLFCQALVLDTDGDYLAILFFDGRDWDNKDVYVSSVDIRMNVGGEIVKYGDIQVQSIDGTNTCMLTVFLGEIDPDDAVYRTKAAFRRVAEKIFEEVV